MFAWIRRAIVAVLVFTVNLIASYWSLRLAKAERLSWSDSLAGRMAAAAMVPGDAQNWIRLAHLRQQLGEDATQSYARAARENPLDVEAYIGLGLEQELAGRLSAAESNLLRAAEISREYVPRSTLANFYFRRDDPAHFWPWAKQALTLGVTDQGSIFSMAWGLSDDPDLIARAILPGRNTILQQYLSWLTAHAKLAPAEKIAARLLPHCTNEDLPSLLYFTNGELNQGRVRPAKAVWDGMVTRRLLPSSDGSGPTGLVNGQFLHEPTNSGLDWWLPSLEGVGHHATYPGLRISFSGLEPESCDPLYQFVAVEGGRRYRLSYEYQTADIPAGSGLAWRVFNIASGSEITKDSPSLMHEQTGSESFMFTTTPGITGVRLALAYRRASGSVRIKGWLQLKQAGLQPVN